MTILERRFRERWARPSDKVLSQTNIINNNILQIDSSQKRTALEGMQKELEMEEQDGVFQIVEGDSESPSTN